MTNTASTLETLLGQGDVAGARALAQERLAKDAEDAEALLALARLTLTEGHDAEAEALLQRAESRGITPATQVVRAGILFDRDDHVGAVALLTGALSRAPELPEAHALMGLSLAAEDELEDAAPHFQKAVELAPDSGVYRYHLAQCLFRLTRIDEAMEHALRAPELAPLHVLAWHLLGNVLSAAGHLDHACTVLQKGLEFHPDHPRLLGALTHVLLRGGHLEGALEVAGGAAAACPQDVEAQTNLALVLLALHRFEEVVRISRGMAARGPVSAALKCAEANALEAKTPADLPGAMKAYQDALLLDSEDWVAANNLAQLLMGETTVPPDRNVPRAVTLLEEARRRAPQQPEPLLNLALAHARSGERTRARQRALETLQLPLPAQHPIREQAERLLRTLGAP